MRSKKSWNRVLCVAALALLLVVFSFAVAGARQPAPPPPTPCADCGKLNEPCPSPVICCPGLTCLSSSGGAPTCVER